MSRVAQATRDDAATVPEATKFSLVCATLGRTGELARLFESLAQQTCKSFELILVDQNDDDRLLPLVVAYRSKLKIEHLRMATKGLSRARNSALPLVTGEIVAFPDDDCWYPPNVLERVRQFLEVRPDVGVLTGKSTDARGEPVGRWDSEAGSVTRANVWTRGISFAMFFRVDAIRQIGSFDPEIGVGSGTPFGSGEETDFLIRVMDAGFHPYYDPSFVIHHPSKQYTAGGVARAFSYGAGMGYVLRRRRFSARQTGRLIVRPLVGAALFLVLGRPERSRYQWSTFCGRSWGYLSAGRRRDLITAESSVPGKART
ncbi:MAG: glycosyl transferase family 2 [Rhodospirillales bacterium]|nr:glycosyl transferase family 2 [Rhodospirillales bacterium]